MISNHSQHLRQLNTTLNETTKSSDLKAIYKQISRGLKKNEVVERYMNAKPVIVDDGQFFKLKDLPVKYLENYSFVWFKKTGEGKDKTSQALSGAFSYKPKSTPSESVYNPWETEEKPCQLKVLQTIKTYHINGCDSFFKPDVVEVLNQMPEELLGKKVYFYSLPPGSGNFRFVYDQDFKAFDEGYHTADTTFYEEIQG